MRKVKIAKITDVLLFLYILSLYLFTYREGLNIISNSLALLFIGLVWLEILMGKKEIKWNYFLLFHFSFIFLCLISYFYALNKELVLSKVTTLILIFIFMLTLVNYVNTKDKYNRVINYFIISGLVASTYILGTANFQEVTRFGDDLGNVNAIGIIIGISFILISNKIIFKNNYYLVFPLVPIFLTILLTGSRKALLFILISLFIMLYVKYKESIKSKIKFLIISTTILIITYYTIYNVPYFYSIIGKRVESLFYFFTDQSTTEGSITKRNNMIEFGVEIAKENPFFGFGLNNYRVLYNLRNSEELYSHNNYIELLVGVGVVGVVLYYAAQLIILKQFMNIKKLKEVDTTKVALLTITLTYLFLGTSLVYYDSKHFSIIIALASINLNSNYLETKKS